MREDVRRLLSGYAPNLQAPDPPIPLAGVLLILHERPSGPHIIFQKRTDDVRDHKGQISFPGGAMDPGDESVLLTALRETHEEIGVDPGHIDVLGRLDDMVTVSNFLVTPFVGWLDQFPYEWRFSDRKSGGSTVEFQVDYKAKSRSLQFFMSSMFDYMVRKINNAFEARARDLHGSSHARRVVTSI